MVSRTSIIIAVIALLSPLIWKYRDQREYNYRTSSVQAANGMDLTNKVVVVTGANTGIGKPTAKTLLSHGATVIMACRNQQKALKAKKDIIDDILSAGNYKTDRQTLQHNLDIISLDLASWQSINHFVTEFKNKYNTLHYLILNAGLNAAEYKKTTDGIELDFGVNHIGHFYLTQLLTDLLAKTASKMKAVSAVTDRKISRVIVVASWAHQWGWYGLNDVFQNETFIQNENEWNGMRTYGFSKACNILFANEYNERHRNENIYAVSIHPGSIPTELVRDQPFVVRFLYNKVMGALFLKSIDGGASTTIRTVSISDHEFIANAGGYFSDCNPAPNDVRSDLFPEGVEKDKMPQKLLWELTKKMIAKYYL